MTGVGWIGTKILAKAVERGLVSSTEHLPEIDIFNLIFQPGFSTADQVTDVSGRGVGMDVVRKQIQKLRAASKSSLPWEWVLPLLLKSR